MKLLFFIPTFNDQDGLVELVRSLVDMHPMSTILVVDDGSKQAIEIPNIGSNVLLHRLPTNMGLGVATSVALDFFIEGGFEYLVRLDADGQHPLDEIVGLLGPLHMNFADVVWGERKNHLINKASEKLLGNLAKRATSSMGRLVFDSFVDDWFTGFFAINRNAALLAVRYHLERYCEVQLLCIFHNANLRIFVHRVSQLQRKFGESSITLFSGVMILFRSLLIIGLYAIRMSPK
jgi:glycosyltransferase involved in cell wall biosynthesis